jgi:hypothetical protein
MGPSSAPPSHSSAIVCPICAIKKSLLQRLIDFQFHMQIKRRGIFLFNALCGLYWKTVPF